MAEYIEYHPLKFWLDPASIAEIVAHIQTYLVNNPINSTTEIETIIHDYLIAHPELIGGVDSVNGQTGEVILTADNISGGENVTIKDVLDSLQNQINDIVISIPSDYQQLIDDVSDLKSEINDIDEALFNAEELAPQSTAAGWLLKANGTSQQDSARALFKYSVSAGQELKLLLAGDYYATYQFQSAASVPAQYPNGNLIGETVTGDVDAVVTVPAGATYLIVSGLINNNNKVLLMGSKIDTLESSIENTTLVANNANIFPFWNINTNGIHIDGSTVVVEQNGFGVKYKGNLYYIASTDQTSVYTFTPDAANMCLVIDVSKLTNINARNNTPTVLSLVSLYNLNKNHIVVAKNAAAGSEVKYLAPFTYFEKQKNTQLNPSFSLVNVCAHAGQYNGLPENTLLAWKGSIAAGDRMVEGDVDFTSDLIPVMLHDQTIDRTSDGTGYCGAMTYNELLQYNFGQGEKIPTLEQYLQLCKKTNTIAEIDIAGKSWTSDGTTKIISQSDAIDAIIEAVNKCNMINNTVLSVSASQARLIITKGIKCPISVSNITTAQAVTSISDIIESFPLVLCSIGTNYTESGLIEAIVNYGCKSKAWTINTAQEIATAFDAGVDYCLTDTVSQNDIDSFVLS